MNLGCVCVGVSANGEDVPRTEAFQRCEQATLDPRVTNFRACLDTQAAKAFFKCLATAFIVFTIAMVLALTIAFQTHQGILSLTLPTTRTAFTTRSVWFAHKDGTASTGILGFRLLPKAIDPFKAIASPRTSSTGPTRASWGIGKLRTASASIQCSLTLITITLNCIGSIAYPAPGITSATTAPGLGLKVPTTPA